MNQASHEVSYNPKYQSLLNHKDRMTLMNYEVLIILSENPLSPTQGGYAQIKIM
jgi:hypothetical protein